MLAICLVREKDNKACIWTSLAAQSASEVGVLQVGEAVGPGGSPYFLGRVPGVFIHFYHLTQEYYTHFGQSSQTDMFACNFDMRRANSFQFQQQNYYLGSHGKTGFLFTKNDTEGVLWEWMAPKQKEAVLV